MTPEPSRYTCPKCGSAIFLGGADIEASYCPNCGTLLMSQNTEPRKSLKDGIFTGLEIKVPKDIQKLLIPGEEVIHSVRQARLEQAVTPDSIFVTTHRIIIRRPTTLGLRKNITDYRYVDMANTEIKKGIINSSIHIKMRFLSEDCCLKGIPNKSAMNIFRTIQERIQLSRGGFQRSQPEGGEDPLQILRVRFARGEITEEEYLSMKRALEVL